MSNLYTSVAGTIPGNPAEPSVAGSTRQAFERALDFGGRTARPHFWWAYLGMVLIAFMAEVVVGALYLILPDWLDSVILLLELVTIIFLAVPQISLYVRRFRDAGFSPWLVLSLALPVVGVIFVLVICLMPTKDSTTMEPSTDL